MQIIRSVSGKKIQVGLQKHNFSAAMHGWGVFPGKKRCKMQKKIKNKKNEYLIN